MGTSGSRFHDELLRQSILTKKSSFSSPYRSTPANLYTFQDDVAESANHQAAVQESEEAKFTEPNAEIAPRQEAPRLPRDWLAEAEAEAQARQGKTLQHQQERKPRPSRAREASDDGGVNMSEFSSPAYRANTVSSQLRLRSAAPATSVNRVGRARSRSQSRSELDQQGPRRRANSNSTGRSRSAGRVRSHSADALTRLHPQYQQSPHQQQHQQQPWRPLPMPTSPGGPPLVRTTAASRGRSAFINHRVGDPSGTAAAVNTRDTLAGRSRPRSSSAGSSRSLQGGQRMYSSFSHDELPTADEFGDVWLTDPPLSRFHGKNVHANGKEDAWQAQQEQQRVQDYHSLYDDYPSQVQNGNIRQPRIKEGPQAGGAGDSYVDLNNLNGMPAAGNDEADDLRLPWSRSIEAHNSSNLQGEEGPSSQITAPATRRGSGRSTSSGRHFAMNLDELLAEMA